MGRTTWLPWGAGIGGTVGFAAAPVRVLRGSEMVRPSPRRLSPRNRHEIGPHSALFAMGNGAYRHVFIDGMDSSRDLNGITCQSRLASKRALGRRSCDE